MSQTPSDTYSVVFRHWKSVRTRLEHTIKDYVEACTTLENALAKTPPTSLHNLREQTFAHLDLELSSLAFLEHSLYNSKSSLSLARNTSYSLAPINSLPSEVLHMVFSLASQKWISEDYIDISQSSETSVTTLASVCRLWRRLMLQSGGSWSQIKLSVVGPTSTPRLLLAELWVERSGDAPLDISIFEDKHVKIDDGADTIHRNISRIVTFVGPLMPRMCRLAVHVGSFYSYGLTHSLVAGWIQNGTIGVAKGFQADIDRWSQIVRLPKDPGANPHMAAAPLATFERFFCTLKTLHLKNAFIDLVSLNCGGLVELHLESIAFGWRPTLSDIVSILSASPKLRSLALIDIYITPLPEPVPEPVSLNELETLTLEGASSASPWLVLLLIISSSSAIRLSLTLVDHPEYISAAHVFFNRCRVTMLSVQGEDIDEYAIRVQGSYM